MQLPKKNDCTFITGNSTTVLAENSNNTYLDEIIDEIVENTSCDVFRIDFQDEISVYRNFTDVVKEIGSKLTFKLLLAMGYDVESLDFKAIACGDLRRFYE